MSEKHDKNSNYDSIFSDSRKQEDSLLENNSNDGDLELPATQQESENSELDKSMIPKNTPKFFTLRDQRQAIFSSPSILNKRKPSTSLEKNLFQEKFKKIAESQSPAEISFKATRSVFGSDNEGENSTSSSHNNISDFNSTLDKFNDNKSRLQYVIGQLKRTNEIVNAFRANLASRYRNKDNK